MVTFWTADVHGKPCSYCGERMIVPKVNSTSHKPFQPTRDHVFPVSKGGWRVIACCSRCNHNKADMNPFEWIEHLFLTNDHRLETSIQSFCDLDYVFAEWVTKDDVLEVISKLKFEVAA